MPTMQELARGLNGSCTSTNTQNDNNKTNRAPTMQELAKGLSEYGITTEEVESFVVEWFNKNNL